MPVASAYGKKIRALSSGKEISEQEHEDLFLWLTENLEEVVGDLWDANPDKLEEASTEAMNKWRSGAKSKLDQFSSITKEYRRRNPDIAKQATSCKKAVTAIVSSLRPWQKSEEFGYASLGKWAGQHPVREEPSHNWVNPTDSRPDDVPSKIVGYVDVAAVVDVVVGLSLKPSIGTEPGDSYESQLHEVHFASGPDKELLQRLKSWRPAAPTWVAKHRRVEVWFDIRAHPVVVGEVLRELRTLREYLPCSPSTVSIIALVVPGCAPQVEELLNHEDFWVVSRSDFESRRLDEVLPADQEDESPSSGTVRNSDYF